MSKPREFKLDIRSDRIAYILPDETPDEYVEIDIVKVIEKSAINAIAEENCSLRKALRDIEFKIGNFEQKYSLVKAMLKLEHSKQIAVHALNACNTEVCSELKPIPSEESLDQLEKDELELEVK